MPSQGFRTQRGRTFRRQRNKYQWIGVSSIAPIAVTAAGIQIGLFSEANPEYDELDEPTLMRTRGIITFFAPAGIDANDVRHAAVGLLVNRGLPAATVGGTPLDDAEVDYFWYGAATLLTGIADTSDHFAFHQVVDSKAMRKIPDDQTSVILVAQSEAIVGASDAVSLVINLRCLFKAN